MPKIALSLNQQCKSWLIRCREEAKTKWKKGLRLCNKSKAFSCNLVKKSLNYRIATKVLTTRCKTLRSLKAERNRTYRLWRGTKKWHGAKTLLQSSTAKRLTKNQTLNTTSRAILSVQSTSVSDQSKLTHTSSETMELTCALVLARMISSSIQRLNQA